RAVVVGAGLAGLAAAWRLRERGFDVEVLERRGQCGGRLGCERVDGFHVESALHVARTSDRHLPGWIHAVGLADELLPLRPVTTAQLAAGRVVATSARSPLEVARRRGVPLVAGLRTLRLPRLMRRYAPLLDRDAPERAARLDDRSVGDFARLYFGRGVYERFCEPLAAAPGGGDADELSRVVFLLEWLAESGGHVGVARRGLSELPLAAAERLGVHTRTRAARIARAGGRLEVEVAGAARREADVVVVATGPGEAAALCEPLLSTPEREHLRAVRLRSEAVLVAALHRPASGAPHYVRVPAVEGEIVDALLVEPGIADGRAPLGGGLATVTANAAFCASSEGANDEVVEKELVSALERIYPTVVGTIDFTVLFRRTAAVPVFEVGAYRALDRFRRVQRDHRARGRRVYFAGDHLAGNAADAIVGSGFRAADEAAADLGA
ncbi:MAG: FAD-dependent oxidoreductase, partial [Myxococcales bacterium]|nr:FAD-dependent oxidoreductase [Myxococcales bacterium]